MKLLLFLGCSLLSAQQINLRQIQSNVSPPPQFAIPFVSNVPGTIIGYDTTHLNWDSTNFRVNLQGAKFLNLTGGGTVCVTASNTGIIAGALCNSLLSPPITLTDISTPANPASGKTNVYTKAGQVCGLSPAGVETCGPSGLSTASFFAAAQTPGGALTAATPATITLAPCPAGVNGADAGHYLYVSSGTGTAESVLVTGGTCTSGAATGTVVFTPANSHSGAWTIQSATAGIQECLQFVGTLGSCVIPVGLNQTYGPINFTANNQSLLGYGRTVSLIRANFNSGNIVVDGTCTSGTCTGYNFVVMKDFGTLRVNGYGTLPTSGNSISVWGAAHVQLQNLYLRHNYNAIDTLGNCTAGASLGNCSLVYMRDIQMEGVANIGVIGFQGTSDNLVYTVGAGAIQSGTYTVTYTPLYEIELLFADGTQFTNTLIGGLTQNGGSAIISAPPACTNCRVGLVRFDTLQVDGWTPTPAVILGGTADGSGFATSGFTCSHCDFSTSGGNTSPAFKVNTASTNIEILNSTFVNLTGKVFDTDSSFITNAVFSNNLMSAVGNGEPAMTLAGGTNWNISGNQWNNGGGGTPTYDLEITGVINGLNVSDNGFFGFTTGALHITSIPVNAVFSDNVLPDSPIAVASASSITLPIGYDNFTISGTTGVNTIVNLYEGRKVTMLTTDGPVLFTAGASIGNTFTSAQNSPVLGTTYSGHLFLSNSSGGATIFSQLGNGSLVRTSSTVITIDSGCSVSTPCPVTVGDTVYVFTSSATATISAGSATANVYIDGSGTRTVAAGADTVVCSGCTATAGTSFPAGVVQYGTWTAASGTWTASGGYTDLAAPLGVKPNTAAGYGLTQSGNTIALDTTVPAFAALTDGATVTWAIANAILANADLTFTVHSGSRTLNLTGLVSGGSYVLRLKQDATGGEGLTLGSGCTWLVAAGGAGTITPSIGANAVDVLAFTYDSSTTSCYANFSRNFN